MKKLLEILKSAGIEIPEEKKADLGKAFSENYKSAGDYNKAVGRLEQERDGYKNQLETLQATAKSFEGLDPEQMKKEMAELKKKAEDAERNYKAQLTTRDQTDWLKAKMDEYGVQSPYARKQLIAECMSAESGLKWKDAETGFFGFDDFMKAAKAQDASLYQTAEEKAAADKTAEAARNAPRFTTESPTTPAPSGTKFVVPPVF